MFFFRPAELYVPLHSIHHGNLLDPGTFWSHFTRGVPDRSNETKCVNVLASLTSNGVSTPMYVDFEHDRKIFIVRFAVLDGLSFSIFMSRLNLNVASINTFNLIKGKTIPFFFSGLWKILA